MTTAKRISILLLTVLFLFSNVAPALAWHQLGKDTFRVRFQNRTGQAVVLQLSGPESISLNLPQKSTTVDLKPGTYKYSYSACGRSFTGTLKVKNDNIQMTLWPCMSNQGSKGGNAIIFLIENKTDGTIFFTFTGPQTYRVTAPPGKTKVEMISGKYTFTARGTGCGGGWDDTGKINVRTGYYWRWFCEE